MSNDLLRLAERVEKADGLSGRYMLGRCANGNERDKGKVIHAVKGWRAMCGREPGRRSAGWTEYPTSIETVNCPRCIRALAAKEHSNG